MISTNTTSLLECYRMLNISPGVNWAMVKKSYRVLALKFHPDHHPGIEGCESRFKEISRAFKILESHYQSSERQECGYSFDGSMEGFPSDESCAVNLETPSSSLQSFFKSILRRRVDKELVTDLKNQLIKSLGQLEKKVFKLDVEKEIKIGSSTVVRGGMVKVRQNQQNFKVLIPQGVWNRMKIRIPNKGETSWFRKKRGDLILDVQVISSDFKVYAGERDLYYDFPVSIETIKKGKMHTLMTIQGVIKFVLPRNTINGQTFILKAKPSTKESLRTNHIVKIQLSS